MDVRPRAERPATTHGFGRPRAGRFPRRAFACTAFGFGLALCGWVAPAGAQTPTGPFPLEVDVATLDGIIAAYYDVVSHAAGEPIQVERDRSLHHPDARAIITGADAEGSPTIANMSLAEYHESAAGGGAFYEWELHRVVRRFGNMADVWSTYAYSDTRLGPEQGRGINSIQLYWDGDRWWITGWIFDNERPGNAIPPEYLPGG